MANAEKLSRTFNSAQQNVSYVVEEVGLWLEDRGLSPDFSADVSLVLAETLNNIVEHAYEYREDGIIELMVHNDGPRLRIDTQDYGNAFDGPPESKIMDGPEQAFEDLPEGGFGWFLIQTLANQIDFERKDGCNCLSLFLAKKL